MLTMGSHKDKCRWLGSSSVMFIQSSLKKTSSYASKVTKSVEKLTWLYDVTFKAQKTGNTDLTILWDMKQCSLMQCFRGRKLTPWGRKQQIATNRWYLLTDCTVTHTWRKHNLTFLMTQIHKTREQVGLFTWVLPYTPTKTKCITSHTFLAYSLV
jgi:hypothetical protein